MRIIYAFGFVDYKGKGVREGTWGWLIPNRLVEAFHKLVKGNLTGVPEVIPQIFLEQMDHIHFNVWGIGPTSKLVTEVFENVMFAIPHEIYRSDEKWGYFEVRNPEMLQAVFQASCTTGELNECEIEWLKSAAEAIIDYMLLEGAS